MTDANVPAPLRVDRERPDRNLALELVRVTEAAAMAAGRWVGRGDKNGADQAAVNAMRQLVSTVSMNGVVVIGEGEKDEAPMLYNGEEVGDGNGPECDVAVDPVDGTTLTAKGMTNAISVMAVADRGAMYDPSAVFYMEKLVTGPAAAGLVDLEAPAEHNIQAVAKAKGCSAEDVTVVVLDRPRHDGLVREIRDAGARIRFIDDGDVDLRWRAVPDALAVVEHRRFVLLALADDDDPVDGDRLEDKAHRVDRRRRAVADALAVVEHRGLILLALADHDDAVKRDAVEHMAHRVHGRLIGGLFVTASDQPRRVQRRRLGNAHEFKCEVAVWSGR